jgi:steroid 5-alpha reductase family enzyme
MKLRLAALSQMLKKWKINKAIMEEKLLNHFKAVSNLTSHLLKTKNQNQDLDHQTELNKTDKTM